MPTSLLWSAGVRKEEEATPNDVVAIDNSAASVREITFHDSIPECYDYCDRSKFSFKFEYFWLIWATDFYIHEIKSEKKLFNNPNNPNFFNWRYALVAKTSSIRLTVLSLYNRNNIDSKSARQPRRSLLSIYNQGYISVKAYGF